MRTAYSIILGAMLASSLLGCGSASEDQFASVDSSLPGGHVTAAAVSHEEHSGGAIPADVPAAPETSSSPAWHAMARSVERAAPKFSAPPEEVAVERHFEMSADDLPMMAAPPPESMAMEIATVEAPAPESMAMEMVAPELAASETVTASAAAPRDESTDPFVTMNVFYGTDRAAANRPDVSWLSLLSLFGAPAIALSLAVAFWLAAGRMEQPRLGKGFAVVTAGTALVLLAAAGHATGRYVQLALQPGKTYDNRRGTLEVGTCEVTIPRSHKEGQLESPSVLRFEFRQDRSRHIVFNGASPLPWNDFTAQLREKVGQSPRRDAFVFVHGYNVSFEEAARRTAQIAYDLKFEGAPIFYSWPSQGGLMQYTVDETNVEWTVPHLKEFLMAVAEESGAESVHLIAHSMGNRALTSALRGISYRVAGQPTPFHEVVLTAPDIDAEVFRRDIAPLIARAARRVTLYASSNDEALIASRRIHGFPRAGDSGANLVVLPGIQTIDVSQVDNTFVGHSYYASNAAVLSDLVDVLKSSKTPEQREWLHAVHRGDQRYWVLLDEMALRARGARR